MIKKLIDYIPAHIFFLLKLYVITLLMFFITRYLFYIINQSSDIISVSVFEKIMGFKVGLEFDTAVFCWIAIVPALVWSIAYFLNNHLLYSIGFYLFTTLQVFYLFVCIANIPYYAQFGSHLNKSAFLWIDEMEFVFNLLFANIRYWFYLILFFVLTFYLIKLTKKIFSNFKLQHLHASKPKWYKVFMSLLVIIAFCFMGARGRIMEVTELHEGLAIVSQNSFVNQIAINPNFTFWKSIVNSNNSQPYKAPANIAASIAYTQKFLEIKSIKLGSIDRLINDTLLKQHNYNIIIVVMESMSVQKMGYYGGKNLTTHLNKLIQESVFCDNFFSSGIHTFNGLFSTSTGFPSIMEQNPMKSYVKKAFTGIGTLLSNEGYETYYYTTQDPHFDNMSGFFKLNHFKHIVSLDDFDDSDALSTLGVPDHMLFDKLIENTNKFSDRKPFVAMLMTGSDHGPWKIPTNITFKPSGLTPQENCTLYADWAIGRFMEQAKKQTWYNNTIFLFLGDHGLSLGHTYEMPLSYNHVPLIIHNPKLLKRDTIKTPCYQPDVTSTIMGIIGAKYIDNTFGLNILKQKHPFVVFSADDKIGCIDSCGFYYYKTLSNNQRFLRKYKNLDSKNYMKEFGAKADSLENNMMHIYNSAEFIIKKNYNMFE